MVTAKQSAPGVKQCLSEAKLTGGNNHQCMSGALESMKISNQSPSNAELSVSGTKQSLSVVNKSTGITK